jgi:hypothetical protein
MIRWHGFSGRRRLAGAFALRTGAILFCELPDAVQPQGWTRWLMAGIAIQFPASSRIRDIALQHLYCDASLTVA